MRFYGAPLRAWGRVVVGSARGEPWPRVALAKRRFVRHLGRACLLVIALGCGGNEPPETVPPPDAALASESEPPFRIAFADASGAVSASVDPQSASDHEIEVGNGVAVGISVTPTRPSSLSAFTTSASVSSEVTPRMLMVTEGPGITAAPDDPIWLLVPPGPAQTVTITVSNDGDALVDYKLEGIVAEPATAADVMGRWSFEDNQTFVMEEDGQWLEEHSAGGEDLGRWEVRTPGELRFTRNGSIGTATMVQVREMLLYQERGQVGDGRTSTWVACSDPAAICADETAVPDVETSGLPRGSFDSSPGRMRPLG